MITFLKNFFRRGDVILLRGGWSKKFENLLSEFLSILMKFEKNICAEMFFWGGAWPHFFCTFFVRVKLGYTPNFPFLGAVEVEHLGEGHYCCCSGGKRARPSLALALDWAEVWQLLYYYSLVKHYFDDATLNHFENLDLYDKSTRWQL